ncbi:MAG: single-stranded DNA-binding protein [Candidatus Brocadiales bacterium]|nr:single-stranded DNA-binding protein [Candidatus Brocadiales bacterium]
MSLNKAMLIGRLGHKPEVKYTETGKAVCNFSVATSENWKDKNGEKKENTEWHNIVVWGKLAETCGQYLDKGRQVFIEGKMQTRSWEDEHAQKRHSTEVNADSVQFLGGMALNGNGVS